MNARRFIFSISLLVLAGCAYVVGSGIYISQTTGTLSVSSSKNALIVVTRDNHKAKIIGTGQAKVLLKPGVYQISATDGAKQIFSAVNISKKRTLSLNLVPVAPAALPSPDSINFSGTGALISDGLSVSQIGAFKQAVFNYKQTAQTAAVSSVTVEPYTQGQDFKLGFNLKIDGTIYKAMITYSGINDVHLLLYAQSDGSQVFDSGVITN